MFEVVGEAVQEISIPGQLTKDVRLSSAQLAHESRSMNWLSTKALWLLASAAREFANHSQVASALCGNSM